MWLNPHRSGYIQRANGRFGIPQTEVCEQARWDDMAGVAATTSTPARIAIRPQSTAETSAAAGFRRYLLPGLCVLYVVYVAWLLVQPDGSARWLYNFLLAGSALVCLTSPLRQGKERLAWLGVGTTLVLWSAGDFYYTLFLADGTASPPTVTDVFWLASYPVLYVSIVLLVRLRTARFDRSLWLDAFLAALAIAAVGAAVLFGAVVDSTGGSPLVAAMNLAYPLADALLLGLVVGVLALTGWRVDRTWACIAAGAATLALADSAYLYQATSGAGKIAVLDAAWPLALLLLAAASRQPVRELGQVRLEGARLLAVPALFGLTSLAILVYGQFESLNTPAVVLAATSMLAVIARMAVSFRDKMRLLSASRVEARTDPLTGIGNRRKLVDDLGATLDAETPAVLILLDLDGFKGYNDSFGHPAGDALLARLAKKLASAVAGEGEVYRIGGDEFCVLGAVDAAHREGFAVAAADAMQEHGDGFRITAAQGSVALPLEAKDVAEALRLVDGRMYDEKDGRRASAGRQSRDVLLRALYERDERLQGRLADIVELVRSVAERLELSADEVADFSLAAELHEVGKLAIPDSILTKSQPLTEEETRFLHRHPLIGERILSSAPALAKVSRFVRSIHERPDGEGYPDGLAGDEIPLGSRIIGACAAFIGLSTTTSQDEALDALRRGEGTEFDPLVVDALAAVVAETGAPLALVGG